MVPSDESTQKPKPLTPTSQHQHQHQHQHQPCSSSSSIPPLMTTNDNPPPPLPNLNSPPRDQQPLTALGYTDQDIATILSFHDGDDDDLNAVYRSSSSNGDKRGDELEGFLKRGIDDTDAYYLGLLPLEYYAAAKRTRTFLHYGNGFQTDDPKGKKKLGESDHDDDDDDDGQRKEPPTEIDFLLNFENNRRNSDGDGDGDSDGDSDGDPPVPNVNVVAYNDWRTQFQQENRKKHAASFARPLQDAPSSSPVPQVELEIDGSPTPFSMAMKAIQDRIKKSTKKGCLVPEPVTWVSKRNGEDNVFARFNVPSLLELSLRILANHADALVSLDGVAEELRHRLSRLLCDSSKANVHFLQLLLRGSPTEIRLKNGSWLTEEQFLEYFRTCDTARLEVLQLDLCGRSIADYTLLATLAQSPSCLPRLISLSLRGACRLTDKGLHVLVSCAPVLRSINLSQCSLLTSASLNILADSLGSILKELYLDDCLLIDAALVVPALKRLEHLEVLSLAGLQTVSDEFIKDYLIACGHNMKELVLKDCKKLTDASMKVIAEHCPGLHVLDLINLCNLTDLSIGYLTNNCQELRTLKLCGNPFSDEAIAAFLETTGESLTELSLNSIKKVGQQTTLSLASHAKNLHTLDLSWCRNLTDNDLGLIVDSCSSLRLLKLFGCTQVTDVFLKGYSNPEIQIIGSKLSPLLQHAKVPPPPQGVLRYSSVSVDFDLN